MPAADGERVVGQLGLGGGGCDRLGREPGVRAPGEEGHWGRMHFCPVCGTTLFWRIERAPGMIYVAVGGFADADFPEPEVAVYGEQAPPWLRIETKTPIRQG
ncbi:MAG TPA: GFA family protein [Cystobacter sp.]